MADHPPRRRRRPEDGQETGEVETAFADGCYSAEQRDADVLLPGGRLEWTRTYGEELLEAVAPGDRLTLDVGFCLVQAGEEWSDPIVARVVLEVSSAGVPVARVEPLSGTFR